MFSNKMQDVNESQQELVGNTNTPLASNKRKVDNTNQLYLWTFTLKAMDPIEPEEPILVWGLLEDKCKKFTFQLERGDGGFLHYQGVLSLKIKERFSTVKNLLGETAHIEPCRNWNASLKYCTKQDTRVSGPWNQTSTFIDIPPLTHKWQLQLAAILELKPDPRFIYWIWEPIGGVGKTVFCKNMVLTNGALVVTSGSSKDVSFMINKQKIILFDFPRTLSERVNYGLIECLKNGLITSAKYETQTKVFNSPHIVCFANFPPPNMEAFSLDRWRIMKIENDLLIEEEIIVQDPNHILEVVPTGHALRALRSRKPAASSFGPPLPTLELYS